MELQELVNNSNLNYSLNLKEYSQRETEINKQMQVAVERAKDAENQIEV